MRDMSAHADRVFASMDRDFASHSSAMQREFGAPVRFVKNDKPAWGSNNQQRSQVPSWRQRKEEVDIAPLAISDGREMSKGGGTTRGSCARAGKMII